MSLVEAAPVLRDPAFHPYIDFHADTLMMFSDGPEGPKEGPRAGLKPDLWNFPQGMVDIKRLVEGGCEAQFFSTFLPPENHMTQSDESYRSHLYDGLTDAVKKYPDKIAFAKSYEDLISNKAKGLISLFLTFEDGRMVKSLDLLDQYYQLGYRLITLTWNHSNCLGNPSSDDPLDMEKGLTPLGKDVVRPGVLPVDMVALAGEAFLYEFRAGRELVPTGEAKDATQCLVGVMSAFACLVVGLGISRLPIVIIGAEVVAVNVQIDMRPCIGCPARSATVAVGTMVQVVGIGLLRGIGIGGLARSPVGRLLLGEVRGGAGAQGDVVVEVALDVGRPPGVKLPLHLLAEVLTAEGCGHGTSRKFQHLPTTLAEGLVMVHLPIVGLPMGIGGLAGEAAHGGVHVNILFEASLAAHLRARRGIDTIGAVVGNHIDHSGQGITAVESTGRTAEYLDALHVGHAQAFPAVIAAHTLAVLENQDIIVAHTIEVHESAHAVGMGGDVRGEARESVLQVGHVGVTQLFGRNHAHSDGRVVGLVIGSRACDDHWVQRHGM